MCVIQVPYLPLCRNRTSTDQTRLVGATGSPCPHSDNDPRTGSANCRILDVRSAQSGHTWPLTFISRTLEPQATICALVVTGHTGSIHPRWPGVYPAAMPWSRTSRSHGATLPELDGDYADRARWRSLGVVPDPVMRIVFVDPPKAPDSTPDRDTPRERCPCRMRPGHVPTYR